MTSSMAPVSSCTFDAHDCLSESNFSLASLLPGVLRTSSTAFTTSDVKLSTSSAKSLIRVTPTMQSISYNDIHCCGHIPLKPTSATYCQSVHKQQWPFGYL